MVRIAYTSTRGTELRVRRLHHALGADEQEFRIRQQRLQASATPTAGLMWPVAVPAAGGRESDLPLMPPPARPSRAPPVFCGAAAFFSGMSREMDSTIPISASCSSSAVPP